MKIQWEHDGNFINYNSCCLFVDNRYRGVVKQIGLRFFMTQIDDVEESFEGSANQAMQHALDIVT